MPEMYMPFDIFTADPNQQDKISLSLQPASFTDEKSRKLISWMNNIDEYIKHELLNVDPKLKHKKIEKLDPLYQLSFRYRENYRENRENFDRDYDNYNYDEIDYPPIIKIKVKNLTEKNVFFNENKSIIFKEAMDSHIIGKGCSVKPLVKHIGVWRIGDRYYNQYHLEKLLVINESNQYKSLHTKFHILDDNDD